MNQLQLPIDGLEAVAPQIILKWEDIDRDTRVLIKNIEREIQTKEIPLNEVNLIIPCRGGEIIGSLLKNALGLKEDQVHRVKISNKAYEGEEGIFTSKEDKDKLEKIEGHKFFIDDLIDSGDTISFIRDFYDVSIYVAVLYAKEGKDSNNADFYVKKLQDNWIVFPWESFYKK